MRWGVTVLAIALLIALVWVSGCANVSLGSAQVGDFGKSTDAQKAQDWFLNKYGNPADYKDAPRFLEPMVSSGIADNTPTDKILKFSDKTPSVYFWVIYEGFKKGDSVTATWTFQGKQFATLSKPVGGNYGAINAQFDKPASGWALGTHTITITGGGATNSVTFEIIAGDTVTAPLPFDETRPSAGSQDLGLARQGAAGAVVPAGGAKPGSDLVKQGVAGAVVPASDDKTVRDLPKQGVVGVQDKGSGVSAQNIAGTCGSDQTMKNGVCVCIDPTMKACGADCVNQLTDPSNCGDCGNVCGSGQTCKSGSCQCSIGGTTACGDKCINLNTDINNCGTCGNICPQNPNAGVLAKSICVGGICSCPTSGVKLNDGSVVQYTMCSNGCTTLQLDSQNCGVCGHICDTGYACHDGSCRKI